MVCHGFKPLSYVLLSTVVLNSALLSTSSVDDLHHDRMSPSTFGSFNFSELEQTLYDVELLKVPLPESALMKRNSEEEPGPNHMVLVSKHGQRYACQLPWETPSGEKSQEKQEEPEHEMNVTALLLPLQSRPCPIKTIGWWTYEYCHGHSICQYHMEGGHIIGKIIYLGFYANETVWDKVQIDRVQGIIDSMKDGVGSGPFPVTYHRVSYANGTVCDRTGKPRTTRVLILCSLTSDDKLYEVTERETCSYNLIIHTSLLCGHPLFDTGRRGRTQTLTCSPLLSQPDYQKYLDEQEQSKEEASTEDEEPLPTQTVEPPQLTLADLFLPKPTDQSHALDQESTSKQDPTPPKPQSAEGIRTKDKKSEDSKEAVTKSKKPASQTPPPSGPASQLDSDTKRLLVGEIEKSIEDLYKQLLSSLDEQADSDSTAAKLKESVVSTYSEFESLKEKNKRHREIVDQLTEDEKNFRETTPPQKKFTGTKSPLKESPAKKERPTVEPYEVQGMDGEDKKASSGKGYKKEEVEVGKEDEILTVERMTELEEAINEQLRESGIDSADVKVIALPLNMMDMLIDDESDDEEDSDSDGRQVRMVFRLDDRQSSLSEKTQSISQIISSYWGGGGLPQEPRVSPEQQRVRDLENSYDQVWGEEDESDKKRTNT